MKTPLLIGAISDTHGVVRPQVYGALEGVDLILHAGDVGSEDVLIELATIAPVHAVRGNMDAELDLPGELLVEAAGWRIFVTHFAGRPGQPEHRIKRLLEELHPDMVITGHT
ncbi:metallophosphoesterase family protein, partial [bacterium]|nr:metallophosphoesterase family protein [candidate division CSSED10-310 bacterium]